MRMIDFCSNRKRNLLPYSTFISELVGYLEVKNSKTSPRCSLGTVHLDLSLQMIPILRITLAPDMSPCQNLYLQVCSLICTV